MQLFPTRSTVHIALAALGTVTAGMILRVPAAVAWGGAIIAGVSLIRAKNKLALVRLRTAGLEMTWRHTERVKRFGRGLSFEIEIELTNRDVQSVRFVELRAIASRELGVSVEPRSGIIGARSSAVIRLRIEPMRVGRYCVHGMALEILGPPGLFEVPLAFASPIGIEVVPPRAAAFLGSARGGRSRLSTEAGAPERMPGAGTELYQVREHTSGDPFKRIAWKASARRGRLMVREFEKEDRDVLWLVLDNAQGYFAGPLGRAPLDRSIDELFAVAERHLSRGDRVGLAVTGLSARRWLAPAAGPKRGAEIVRALLEAASMLDADRSDLGEQDVARRVLDHLRFLDAGRVAALSVEQLESLVSYAEMQIGRAPFDLPAPWAATPRDQSLRRYLACYGISSPPKVELDRGREHGALLRALERALKEKPRPSLVCVWSNPPDQASALLGKTIAKLRRRGIAVRWASMKHEAALEAAVQDASIPNDTVGRIVTDAIALRARIARERGERELAALGVKLVRPGQRISPKHVRPR